MIELDKIYLEDCIEGMKAIPDGSVDMICTDPPFGSTANPWDRQLPLPAMWAEFMRVTKENAAIVIFSQLSFAVDVINANRKLFRYEWIWEKSCPVGFLNAKKMPLRLHENILVFYRHLPTYNPQFWQSTPYKKSQRVIERGCYRELKRRYVTQSEDGQRYPVDIVRCNSGQSLSGNKQMYHPTQKPVELLEYLIKTYSNEGETVLDACMGSGSTAVACINTERRFIGFETVQQYFDIAEERIRKAKQCRIEQQLTLDVL